MAAPLIKDRIAAVYIERRIMYDELTEVDIKKMEEEITYRKVILAPELGAELKRTRELGDLSENAEYKEAKYLKRKNESRIRYLEAMIRTAKVIDVEKKTDAVSLFDRVVIYNEKMKPWLEKTQTKSPAVARLSKNERSVFLTFLSKN